MKSFIYLLGCLVMALTAGCAHASLPLVMVKSQGETLIATTVGKLNVQVTIETHEMQIGKPGDGRPPVIKSSCTYSKYPCSPVDRINIVVNGNVLFVPRSVFCDLADLNKAEVKAGEKGVILALYGGDASESYIVKVEFDADNVKRRVLSSAMIPDQPLQETTYYVQVLGD